MIVIPANPLELWPYAFGYFYAVIIGQWFVHRISKLLYEGLGITSRPAWGSEAVGLVERVLFVTVLLLSHGEFIVAWLGIKTAGGWVHWSKESYVHVNLDGTTVEVTGRNVFNVFLANQGVSLLFAGAGWLTIGLGNRHAWLAMVAVAISLVVAAELFKWRLKHQMKKDDSYKGYRIESRIGSVASTPAAPPFSPVTFHVYRKGGNRLHTGEVSGRFNSPQEAFNAGHEAARKWIDAQGN